MMTQFEVTQVSSTNVITKQKALSVESVSNQMIPAVNGGLN